MPNFDTITGVIARRILLNFRIEPEIAREILPAGFRPQLYQRYAIGGVCLVQFADIRSNFLPIWMAPNTNTASYRIAVSWEENGRTRLGTYVPRRESNSFQQRPLGDKAFPRIFSRSRFDVLDTDGLVHLKATGIDDGSVLEFRGRTQPEMTPNSVFGSVQDAIDFFRTDTATYFPSHTDGFFHGEETTGVYYGLEIEMQSWEMTPMRVEAADSSFFDDRRVFPPGSIEFDSAFIMRNVEHAWNTKPSLRAGADPMRFCEPAGFKSLSVSEV